MNKLTLSMAILVLCGTLMAYGCFPSKKVVIERPDSLTNYGRIETPSKVFMKDSSVVVFQEGFIANEIMIQGEGERFWIEQNPRLGIQTLQMDSIALISHYEEVQSDATKFGSFIIGWTGTGITVAAIHCLTCPKCCFGSCPTVYTTDGSGYGLEAELFSYSLSKYFQETDVDRLIQGADPEGRFQLRLTNEALETHYINQFNLLAVRHDKGTEVYPTADGGITFVKNLLVPEAATGSVGEDARPVIEKRDDLWHYGDSTRIEQAQTVFERDWLDLTLMIPEGAETVKLVIKARNTLLSTVLFYDVVLASQGVGAIEWTHRLNSDPVYASLYHLAYNQFAGMEISINREGEWEKIDRLGDVGPIAWKEQAVELPVAVDENKQMRVRLEWFPDNFMIDYIGYDAMFDNYDHSISIDEIIPQTVTNFLGDDESEILINIKEDDSDFMVTNPGDYYDFEFNIPDRKDVNTTLFIKSKGYYTEWLRGDWIAYREDGYRFNLFEADKTLEQLKKSWIENRQLLEETFFETKIPLKEGL